MFIECFHLTKTYGSHCYFEDVNITFQSRKIHGIVSQGNHCAEVFLKCLCGYLRPSSGYVFINGESVHCHSPVSDRVGTLLRSDRLYTSFSGQFNLRIASNDRVNRRDIVNAMSCVGLDPTMKRCVSQYSPAMQQLLRIARVLISKPQLLFLEAPFSNLDCVSLERIETLLFCLRKNGATIILTDDNTISLQRICDHIYCIKNGEVIRL